MDIRYRLTTKAIIPACGDCGRREREYACVRVRFKSALHHCLFPLPVLFPPAPSLRSKVCAFGTSLIVSHEERGKGKKHLLMTLTQRASFALFFPLFSPPKPPSPPPPPPPPVDFGREKRKVSAKPKGDLPNIPRSAGNVRRKYHSPRRVRRIRQKCLSKKT